MRDSAETTFGRAIGLLEELLRDFPSVPVYRDELAAVYRTRGLLFQEVERSAEAEQAFHKSLAIHVDLAKEFPRMPDYQSRLADDYLAIAGLHMNDRTSLTLEHMLAKALDLQKDLVERYPESWEYHKDLYNTWTKLGTRIDQRRSPESPSFFRDAMHGSSYLCGRHHGAVGPRRLSTAGA